MSLTESFVDPVFLARFGLSRVNALDYFMHPLNPFFSMNCRNSMKNPTSNQVLAMQGIDIGNLMQHGTGSHPSPLTLAQAEDEYNSALSKLCGEQYELMPSMDRGVGKSLLEQLHSPLYTIRHVLRTNPTTLKVLGVYYIVEGVIYKSPTVRSVMKSNVALVLQSLEQAYDVLNTCTRYEPSTGYTWDFESNLSEHDDEDEILKRIRQDREKAILTRLTMQSHKSLGRSEYEEEGIRASETLDKILVRLNNPNKAF